MIRLSIQLPNFSQARGYRSLVVAIALSSFAGCNDGRPELVPVSGQVLIDGEPLKFGSIRFAPSDARASTGRLDQDGRFTLTCYEQGDGVVVGNHRVSVSAGESLNEEQTRWHAPKKYAKFKESGLVEEITEATSSVTIRLSWDGKKPYVQGTPPASNSSDYDDGD